MLAPGLRIVRGPDWNWGNQDGGEGFVGTVCEIGQSSLKADNPGSPDKTVVVQWDNGNRTNYRVGYMGKYDLRIIDNAQIGVKHSNIKCDGCESQGISGIRYKCTLCHDYDLCYKCYHQDIHSNIHPFKRFDSACSRGTDLPQRLNERKCNLYGIFVDAKVVRGFNWEWGNQDGGEGKIGKVVDVRGWDSESNRSVVNVHWFSGSTNVYRLGHKGICDIKFAVPSCGGTYYPEHLPVLGQIIELPLAKPIRTTPVPFSVGDKVRVSVPVEQLKLLQQGHGGWNPRMAEYIGKIGIVHRVTDKGDIRVQFESCNNRWTFIPGALMKVNSFNSGDIVTLITNIDEVKKLQSGHGEWIDIMKNSLGKLGKVLKVYSDGDLRVQIDGKAWTLNPLCVRTVPGSATELANTMNANQRQEPSIQWHPALHNQPIVDTQSNPTVDSLVRAAAQGHLEVVQRILEDGGKPTTVDARSNGKTALQVACHQGQIAVIKYLLRSGASVNAADSEGDTCLHYAAFGNSATVIDLLTKFGANLNVANSSGCTPLHVAAHKFPGSCTQVLLAAGANPNKVDFYGDTPLHDAVGKDSIHSLEFLCYAPGTDFTLRNKRGFNVLHQAALKGKNMAMKRLLLHARQLVDVKKDDGFSALHLGALNGHKDIVETLIRHGNADINLRNNRNQTALLLAVSQGHCEVIELLLQLGADKNVVDEDGDSALHIILLKRNQLDGVIVNPLPSPAIYRIFDNIEIDEHKLAISIACYLIQEGINTEIMNNKGQTAIDLLEHSNTKELLKSYFPIVQVENHIVENAQVILPDLEPLSIQQARMCNFNLTENSPKNKINEEQKVARRSRKTSNVEGNPSQINSPKADDYFLDDDGLKSKPECLVCSEYTENVILEPCGHHPACEECSTRMKKCLVCTEFIQRRVTKDGKIIPVKNRQPSAERMKYLETKIAEIEESHACSICMERNRNVVFLCGHGTCQQCADTLKTCHMCRKTITKKIPIY